MLSAQTSTEIILFAGTIGKGHTDQKRETLNGSSGFLTCGGAGLACQQVHGGVQMVVAELRTETSETSRSAISVFFAGLNLYEFDCFSQADLLKKILERFPFDIAGEEIRLDILTAFIQKISAGFNVQAAGIGTANSFRLDTNGKLQPLIQYPHLSMNRNAGFASPLISGDISTVDDLIYQFSPQGPFYGSAIVISGSQDLRGLDIGQRQCSGQILNSILTQLPDQVYVAPTQSLAFAVID